MMISAIKNFLKCESGATAIEYSIIAAGIAAVIVSAVMSLGTEVDALWDSVDSAVQ